MKIEAKVITPTNIFLSDINKPLKGKYWVAAVELGHDLTNGGYTFGPVEAFSMPINQYEQHCEVEPWQCILVNIQELSSELEEPGYIMFFLSKDGVNYIPVAISSYTNHFCIFNEHLRSAPKFNIDKLASNFPDYIIGDRNPQPGPYTKQMDMLTYPLHPEMQKERVEQSKAAINNVYRAIYGVPYYKVTNNE